MTQYLNEKDKLQMPYYQIMELSPEDLKNELVTWSRLELIDWLCWNDANGVYTDEDSLAEFNNILGKEEAIEIIMRQIAEEY